MPCMSGFRKIPKFAYVCAVKIKITMKKTLKTLLLFFFAVSSFAQDYVEVSDVKVPTSFDYKGTRLVLNGAGLREKLFLDLYVMGLYVKNKTKDPEKIINADEPMVANLHIVSRLVTKDKMLSSIQEGFEKALGSNISKMQPEIDRFKAFFKKELKVGDLVSLRYSPGEGTSAYLNGQYLGTIKGLDFKKALFAIWLGEDPVDEDLKEGILGLD